MTPQSTSKKVPWDLTQFFQSPAAAPLYFPESRWWSEISSLSKVTLVLGKARSHRPPDLGCREAEAPGWFGVSPINSARDVMSEQAHCHDEADHSCGLLNHPISYHRVMFKPNAKLNSDSLLYSLSHFECDSHTVHVLIQQCLLPPWLVQWSRHWLPGYIDVVQTIFIVLTMVGLFLDRTRMSFQH